MLNAPWWPPAIETQPEFAVRSRETLFQLSPRLLTTTPWEPVVDVTQDGERFLMMRRMPDASEDARYRLVLVENFGEELRERLQGLKGGSREALEGDPEYGPGIFPKVQMTRHHGAARIPGASHSRRSPV